MAKKVVGSIKLQVPAGAANPSPPVGPALGQRGVNIMEFCKAFNAQTQNMQGLVIPVIVTVYADRSFTFITKSPPASILLLKAASVDKGSATPNKNKVGKPDACAGRGDRENQDERPDGQRPAGGLQHRGRHGALDGNRDRGVARGAQNKGRKKMAGKKYKEAEKKIDRDHRYTLEEAVKLVIGNKVAKFDETVELAVRLGVDPRQADQNVRGTVVLPHGTGKVARVLVIAKGDKEREAREAGADFVGGDDIIKKIQEENWLDFDRVIATPDMMGQVGRIGKILGPRGLMPNPKVGTVTFDVAKAVGEVKAGKVDYRVDKAGVVHARIGKLSFGEGKLLENANSLLGAIMRAKPSSAKGNYVRSVALSSTMGPGVKVDTASAARVVAQAA